MATLKHPFVRHRFPDNVWLRHNIVVGASLSLLLLALAASVATIFLVS